VRLAECSLDDPPVVEFEDGMCRCVLARGAEAART
jgi:hypothetical protein